MSKPIIIIGAGGHAKPLIDTLKKIRRDIIGALDADPGTHGTTLLAIPVLGGDDDILKRDPANVLLVNGIGFTSSADKRRDVFLRFKERGYSFATVIHPSAVIAMETEIGEGCQIMAGAVLQPLCRIGANSIINTKASVDHDCTIGDHCHIAPGATICGEVTLGNDCFMGAGATITHGLTIGDKTIIGAGATVINDLSGNETVCGIPARRI